MLKALGALTALLLVLNQFFSYPVLADEYVVSGNGDNSTNSISSQLEEANSIDQENGADINNSIDALVQTGENEASDNLGEVEIETGDAAENITVVNSGNINQLGAGCCEDVQGAQILDNGTGSENEINLNQSSLTKTILSNNLTLKNNIKISANTGDNEASDNSGNVYISTGKINIRVKAVNNLNTNKVLVPKNNPTLNLDISGNGLRSDNLIDGEIKKDNQYLFTNSLLLRNNFTNYLNTGGNKASGNSGNVFISTGSVMLDLIIMNRANSNMLSTSCCQNFIIFPIIN